MKGATKRARHLPQRHVPRAVEAYAHHLRARLLHAVADPPGARAPVRVGVRVAATVAGGGVAMAHEHGGDEERLVVLRGGAPQLLEHGAHQRAAARGAGEEGGKKGV